VNTPLISIVAAIGENRELGKDNKLLWHIPGELPRFKTITMGHPIVMGRKTFESIGRVLPGRLNIVISRSTEHNLSGISTSCLFVTSIASALTLAKEYDQDEIFIIGGGQIYEQALPFVDRLYLTVVHSTFDADTFFPDYSQFTKVIEKEDHDSGEYKYTFLTLGK
jgi:dihydrofolate reductase